MFSEVVESYIGQLWGVSKKNEILIFLGIGMGVRFDLAPFKESSTRLGRKFMKLRDHEEVVSVETLDLSAATPILAVASQRGRALVCKAEEASLL